MHRPVVRHDTKLPPRSDSPAGLWTNERGSGLAAGPPHGYPSLVGLPDPPGSPPGSPDVPYDPRGARRVACGITALPFHYVQPLGEYSEVP
ncbi:predicted protein [Streptomyces sp. C]|nr:predicted protein [Streptomyces sp. C]